MEKFEIAGVEINKVTLVELLFNKRIFIAYILLVFAVIGMYQVIHERYLVDAVNAFDAGLNVGNPEFSNSVREAIFGGGFEVRRESAWTLYISHYMYMIYSGSGIIFIVALAEIFNVKIIKKTAAGFMTIGLVIVLGGLFTIVMDLNILSMKYMFLTPNISAGMWLMLPLYSIYIPFVIFEIYLIITKKQQLAKKIAFTIILISILIDIAEFYIQAKLFDMNIARQLWTTYPNLTVYFIVSSFVAAGGIMLLYSFIEYRKKLGEEFSILIIFLLKITLLSITALAVYEAVAFLFIAKDWANVILFGGFKYDFYIYVIFAIVIPFALLSLKLLKSEINYLGTIIASISIMVGTFIGRLIFVYGGNAFPMSDRFGTGFEKYGEYRAVKDFIYFAPHLSEIFIVIGSIGVSILIYTIIDKLFSVSKIRDHSN